MLDPILHAWTNVIGVFGQNHSSGGLLWCDRFDSDYQVVNSSAVTRVSFALDLLKLRVISQVKFQDHSYCFFSGSYHGIAQSRAFRFSRFQYALKTTTGIRCSPIFADWTAVLILINSFFGLLAFLTRTQVSSQMSRTFTFPITLSIPLFCSQSKCLCFCSSINCHLPGTKSWLFQ